MGSGKSHWGGIWAQKHGMNFYDIDHIIEKETGLSITQIFEQKGEGFFREKETEALQAFQYKTNCIVATGGGSPCFNNNMQWMNDHGATIFLSAGIDHIYQNVSQEQSQRPLLKGKTKEELFAFIEKKMTERLSIYQQAQLILQAEQLNEESLNFIITQI